MGRRRMIDRDAILDAAEEVVTESGAAQLTFDAVAARAGVSKGGVLYCYPSKAALVAAMGERDLRRFEAEVAERVAGREGEAGAPYPIRAHLAATHGESKVMAARAASLMAAMMNADTTQDARAYYREKLDRIDASTPAGRKARVAFLACEGAFLLRGMGLAELTGGEWDAMFDDIAALVE